MTTMLEKAARAAQDAGPGSCLRGLWLHEATTIARAVFMAVREPSDNLSAAAQSTEGWEAMIDAILSEASA